MSVQVSVEGHHLSIVGQGITEIPVELGQQYGESVTELDFTENAIRSVSNLEQFVGLKSLVLDHNELISKQDFPHLPNLETLWINANAIDSLDVFLDAIQHTCPKLNYLSMLKNPCCPNYFVGKDNATYQKYRYSVLARIPGLKFLDASPITAEERAEAHKIASATARPEQSQYGRPSDAPIVEEERALPPTDPNSKGPTTFGVAKYVYYGRQSEGNRFILDSQL